MRTKCAFRVNNYYIDDMVSLRYSFSMTTRRANSPYDLCQFTYADGRMCGLPTHPKGEGLCLTHFRACRNPKPLTREDDLSAELRSPAGDFLYQIDINHVLGKLFEALAANRISSRRASTLAYIAHLLAQTQQGAKYEANRWELDKPTYERMLELKYPGFADESEPAPQETS